MATELAVTRMERSTLVVASIQSQLAGVGLVRMGLVGTSCMSIQIEGRLVGCTVKLSQNAIVAKFGLATVGTVATVDLASAATELDSAPEEATGQPVVRQWQQGQRLGIVKQAVAHEGKKREHVFHEIQLCIGGRLWEARVALVVHVAVVHGRQALVSQVFGFGAKEVQQALVGLKRHDHILNEEAQAGSGALGLRFVVGSRHQGLLWTGLLVLAGTRAVGVFVAQTRCQMLSGRLALFAAVTARVGVFQFALLAAVGTLRRRAALGLDHGQGFVRVCA